MPLEPTKHAPLSPSDALRWINCPGAIRESKKFPPSPDSSAAMLGTAAHQLAEKCLNEDRNAREYIEQKLLVIGSSSKADVFTVDDDMVPAVQVYLDTVREFSGAGVITATEHRVSVPYIHKGVYGTADYTAFIPEEKKVVICDYKHGVEISVDPEWEPQFLIYALGEIDDLVQRGIAKALGDIETVEIIVVQPRDRHNENAVRRWVISIEQLTTWAETVLRPAAERTDDPVAPLVVGKWCRFCNVALCDAKGAEALALAKTEFSNPIFPDPANMSAEELGKVVAFVRAFSTWTEQVDSFALQQAQNGVLIPGCKLVAKGSKRRWKDEEEAETKLAPMLGEDSYKKKFLSMPQAEKKLTELGLNPATVLDGLWEKPDNGVVLADISDKRKAVAPAITEFAKTAAWMG